VSATGTVTSFLRVVAGVEFEAGRRTQNEAGTYLDVPSFATANLKGVWTIRGRVDAELGLLNAFDKSYWVADGYPEAGRTVLTTLRYKF
jgi:iron complex outermembrane receptor protein